MAGAALLLLSGALLCAPSPPAPGREILVYPAPGGGWRQASSFWDVPMEWRDQARLVAQVARVPAFDRVVLTSGREVRLLGLGLPDPVVRPAGFAEQARARLDQLVRGKWIHLEPEEPSDLGRLGETAGYVWVPKGICLNEVLLREGRVLLFLDRPGLRRRDPLLRAARAAQEVRAGWFGRPGATRRPPGLPAFLKGGVVGLYYQDPALSYEKHLAHVKAVGAEWVSFLFTGFLDRADSIRIDRFGPKTVRDDRLALTVRQARKRGLRVMFLPIVHLRHMGDDWRGSLRPRDPMAWFRSYLAFILHYADLAQAWGVEIFSGGSEFCSLEARETLWRWIFRNLRGRYAGLLTYSFNWDHFREAPFLDMLDFLGMTAYWSLTKKNDPTREELVRAWEEIRKDLEAFHEKTGAPIVFTELGYPSQDGANKDPWNYVLNPEKADPVEQADCLAAFARVFREPGFLRGVFFFDWFEEGGPGDPSYTPQGKPGLEVIRNFFRNVRPAPPARADRDGSKRDASRRG